MLSPKRDRARKESIWKYNTKARRSVYSKRNDPVFQDASTDLHKFRLEPRKHSKNDEFDFMRARNIAKSTSLKGGIIALVKGCLGSGVMAAHIAYTLCGLWTALAATVFLGLILSYCMYELIRAAQKMYKMVQVSTMSYADLAEATLEVGPCLWLRRYSRCFRHVVEVFCCINGFGNCMLDQVFIGRCIKQLIEGLKFEEVSLYMSIRLYIAPLLVPCALFSMLTNMKHLAPFSIIADFCIGITAIATIYYGSLAAGSVTPLQRPAFTNAQGLFEGVGILLFAMNGIDISLPVENSIKNPRQFPLVVVGGMTVVTLVVMIFGFFGDWGFGDRRMSPIALNFPWYTFGITCKMFTAVVIFLSYPLYFYVPFNQVWYYLSSYYDNDRLWLWERVYRVLISVACSLLAILLRSAGNLAAFLGAFNVSILGLVLPVLISLYIDWENPGPGKYYWRLWKTIAIVLLGLVIFCFSASLSAIKLVKQI